MTNPLRRPLEDPPFIFPSNKSCSLCGMDAVKQLGDLRVPLPCSRRDLFDKVMGNDCVMLRANSKRTLASAPR